jgi:hypothetical protein
VSLVLVVRRGGIYASVNLKYHAALVGWWRLHWGRT